MRKKAPPKILFEHKQEFLFRQLFSPAPLECFEHRQMMFRQVWPSLVLRDWK